MDINKLKPGKRVSFTSRTRAGNGTVESTYVGGRGAWVVVKTKDVPKGSVIVRPTQVSPR